MSTPLALFGRIRSRGLTEYGNPTPSTRGEGGGYIAIEDNEAQKSSGVVFREKHSPSGGPA